MSKHDDGGPAFPIVGQPNPSEGKLALAGQLHHGMTLRDYFAAAALHGITNLPSVGRYKVHQWAGDWAEWSYSVADAMLAERAKRKEQP